MYLFVVQSYFEPTKTVVFFLLFENKNTEDIIMRMWKNVMDYLKIFNV